MRWWTFILVAYVTLGLETGLRPLWMVPWAGGVAPCLVLTLAVFVVLWAPPLRALWSCLLLGLLVDVTHPLPLAAAHAAALPGGADVAVLGPYALGFLVAGQVCLRARNLVFKDSALSLAALTFIMGLLMQAVVVALLNLRGVALPGFLGLANSPIPGWETTDQLVARFLEVAYSALVAWPFGIVLLRTARWWGFEPAHP